MTPAFAGTVERLELDLAGQRLRIALERDDYHLTCVQCGSSQALPLCPLSAGSLGLGPVLLQGFKPLFHTFEIHALCSRCQQGEVGLNG